MSGATIRTRGPIAGDLVSIQESLHRGEERGQVLPFDVSSLRGTSRALHSVRLRERIIDFRNYDKSGRRYVLLDEAHKGDKEDSKRQHISAE